MANHVLAVDRPTGRRTRSTRSILIVIGLLVGVVGILVGVKAAQIGSLISVGKKMQAAGPPPETVSSFVARAQPWESTLSAVGSVSGLKSVAVATEVPGVVTRIAFESGQIAKEGQILVELDNSVERAQVASARARRDLAEVNLTRMRKLAAGNAVSRQQVDESESQMRTASTDMAALQAQLDRKVIRAPFKGRLGIRAVNLGQFVSVGTTVTTLDSLGESFVDFSLPQEQLANVSTGLPVRITQGSESASAGPRAEAVQGTIAAIEPTVDPLTRNVKIRAAIPQSREQPRPGTFVNVSVVLPARPTVVTVPETAIVHASYGDSVFVIEDKKPGSPGADRNPAGKPVKVARQQFVRLGGTRGDFVAVAKGLSDGQTVVSAGAFKLRNNAPIVVDDAHRLNPQLDPHPTNR